MSLSTISSRARISSMKWFYVAVGSRAVGIMPTLDVHTDTVVRLLASSSTHQYGSEVLFGRHGHKLHRTCSIEFGWPKKPFAVDYIAPDLLTAHFGPPT